MQQDSLCWFLWEYHIWYNIIYQYIILTEQVKLIHSCIAIELCAHNRTQVKRSAPPGPPPFLLEWHTLSTEFFDSWTSITNEQAFQIIDKWLINLPTPLGEIGNQTAGWFQHHYWRSARWDRRDKKARWDHYRRQERRERGETERKNVKYLLLFSFVTHNPACFSNALIQTLSDLAAHIRMSREQTAPQNSYSCCARGKCPHTYIPHVVTSLRGPPHSDVTSLWIWSTGMISI